MPSFAEADVIQTSDGTAKNVTDIGTGGAGGGTTGNVDGGAPDSVYGGGETVDGGTP